MLFLCQAVSFDSADSRLVSSLNFGSQEKYFNAFITIYPPHSIMTISKIPSHFSVDHGKENFVVLLSLLLQSTEGQLASQLPFTVVAMQQIFYQNQLQLALLCQTGAPSFSKLRADLKNVTLADLLPVNDKSYHLLSGLPLSNIMRIQPYDAVLNGNIWEWNNSSIAWHWVPLVHTARDNSTNGLSQSLSNYTSCVVLGRDFYMSSNFRRFFATLLHRFTVAGMRYFHGG